MRAKTYAFSKYKTNVYHTRTKSSCAMYSMCQTATTENAASLKKEVIKIYTQILKKTDRFDEGFFFCIPAAPQL